MDQQTLRKIARLRILAAKEGKSFDLVKFAADRAFASETLAKVLASQNEEILTLGLEVMEALNLMQAGAEDKDGSAPSKYIGKLR